MDARQVFSPATGGDGGEPSTQATGAPAAPAPPSIAAEPPTSFPTTPTAKNAPATGGPISKFEARAIGDSQPTSPSANVETTSGHPC